MIKRIRAAVAPYSKAIVGYVSPIIVGVALRYGLHVDVSEVNVIVTSIITGTTVYAKANK